MKKIFNRKSVFVKSLSVWSAFAATVTTSAPAFAAGTAVLGGSAELTGHARASLNAGTATDSYAQFVADAGAASAVLDWSKFNIGAGKEMNFSGAGTTFFNLVDGAAGKSQIDGMISGNGNVWVINPAGIAFGASSSVDVGGLFAAAAGNLENAAALRDGTATMPSFSSFEGSVDASRGTFTADQVALMGRTVSAGGNFSGVGNLTISATGGAMDVDEVQGGKVSVNIRDFTADGSEVTLGDLQLDGDLTVKATGSVMAGAKAAETPADKPMLSMAEKKGPVIQAGDIGIEGADLEIEGKLQSTAGHVDVLAYGSLDVNAEVNAAGHASLQALGDIDVNADVVASGGDATIYSCRSVTVEAGKTVSALGNVDVTAGMGDGVNGDVTINGNVESSFGNVMLYSGYGDRSTGDVTINGNVTAEYGGIDVYAGFGYALGTLGKLTVNGNLTGCASVSLKTGNGSIEVGKSSVVSATGFGGEVDVYTAADAGYGLMTGAGHKGDIVIDGELVANGTYGQVDVVAGKEVGASGSVTLNGSATSDYFSELAARTGSITVNGRVQSLGNVTLNTESGDIELGANAEVKSLGGSEGLGYDVLLGYVPDELHSVGIYSAMKAGGKGNVKIGEGGKVSSEGSLGYVTIATGLDGNYGTYTGGDGNVTVMGNVSASDVLLLHAKGGTAKIEGAGAMTAVNEASVAADKDIAISGSVTSEGVFSAVSSDGAINASGKLDVEGNATFRAKGTVVAGNSENHLGGMTVAEGDTVSIAAKDGLSLGHVEAYGEDGTVAARTESGKLEVLRDSEVYAPVSVSLLAGLAENAQGTIEINGTVGGAEVFVGNGVRYELQELYPGLFDYMPYSMGGNGDVNVSGEIQAGSRIMLGTDNGDIIVAKSGKVVASGLLSEVDVNAGMRDGSINWEDLSISGAGRGNVTINGMVGSGDLGITFVNSGYGLGASGDLTVNGVVGSGALGSVYLNGGYGAGYGSVMGSAGQVTGSGQVAADGFLQMSAAGSIAFAGAVSAKDAALMADGDIAVANAQNDICGVLDAQGKSVSVTDQNGITLGNVEATDGDVAVVTETGSIAVEENSAVSAQNGSVSLVVARKANGVGMIVVEGSVSADDAAYLHAGYGDDARGDVVVNGEVKASESVTLISQRGVTGVIGDGSVDAGTGRLTIVSDSAHVNFNGRITAGDASFTALDFVSAVNSLNDFTGVVSADAYGQMGNGTAIQLRDSNDIRLGDVYAMSGNVQIQSVAGAVVVENGATVTVDGANAVAHLESAAGAGRQGDVVVDGSVVANGAGGRIELLSGSGSDARGDVSVTGSLKAQNEGGRVLVQAADGAGASGSAVVDGEISAAALADIKASNGDVSISGGASVTVEGQDGSVLISAATADGAVGEVRIDGNVLASGDGGQVSVMAGTGDRSRGDVTVNGVVSADKLVMLEAGTVNAEKATSGDVCVNGRVRAGGIAYLVGVNGDARVKGSVSADSVYVATGLLAGKHGDAVIEGSVEAGKDVFLMAGVDEDASGDVHFGEGGSATAGEGAFVVVKHGSLTQDGAFVGASKGYADVVSLPAALSAKTINLKVESGDIGSGAYGYVAVDGKTYAEADGNVSVAAANGGNLKGGAGVGTKVTNYGTITFGDPNGTSNIKAGGDLSVYTAGLIESSGIMQADGDVTVAASSCADLSYLRAGGRLTVNDVGHPAYPQIAYFESVNGIEPKINNQPNDMVIFVDGRLAGGNLNILNKFGADEAFMVETPELKSTQGIFGNPPFLHSDLDVANPLAVSAVDYLIQEVPRLTLSSDFPADVDQTIEATGLGQKDSYWFGQKGANEKKSSAESTEKTADAETGAAKPSGVTVARVR